MMLLAMANIGGIGGGGLIIPITIALFGFATREAIALSNATIFLGALTRFVLFSTSEKHPNNPDKTVIDYSLTGIMIPMVLVGSYTGVLINVMMPEVALAILLTLLLVFLTFNTTQKGRKLWRKETEAQEKEDVQSAEAEGLLKKN